MRNVTPKQKSLTPSVEELRAAVDARLEQNGLGKRGKALRAVDMASSSFERILHKGLSDRSPVAHHEKLRRLGILDLIPRR